jgi:hypothetical protein
MASARGRRGGAAGLGLKQRAGLINRPALKSKVRRRAYDFFDLR